MIKIQSIPIPGLTTFRMSAPDVRIVGDKESVVGLRMSYRIYEANTKLAIKMAKKRKKRFGEILFAPLIGFRFSWAGFVYDDFPEIDALIIAETKRLKDFGLFEISHSPYIEHMLSTNRYSHLEDRMGDGAIKESDVKHYRISFDEYGHFDILALEVWTREYKK